jgi:hypothetical protein
MMGFLDRLFGRRDDDEEQRDRQEQQRRQDELRRSANATRPMGGQYAPGQPGQPAQLTDEQAVERYRYMLRTAPPETIEQAHAEAFAQLTPQQRQMVLQELTSTLPESERRAGVQYRDDPQSLARMATRAEMRQPGTMERTMNNVGGQGISMGGLMAGSFFSSFAGMMVGSMVASAFFGGFGGGGYNDGYQEGYQEGQQDAENSDTGDSGDYGSADSGDYGGGDYGGGDFGDFGGDFGGGDFGGGDF